MPIDEKNVCFSFIEECLKNEYDNVTTISCDWDQRFAFYADDELVEIVNNKTELVIRCIDDCTSDRVARIIAEQVNDCEANEAICAEAGTLHTQLGVDFATVKFYDSDFAVHDSSAVRKLFDYIYTTLGFLDYHPDDSLLPYADGSELTTEDLEYLNACVDSAKEWCFEFNEDIYSIGLHVLINAIANNQTK